MSEPDPARWYDYVMLVVFVLHLLGAFFLGSRFLRQPLWIRVTWALGFTFLMLGWIVVHRT